MKSLPLALVLLLSLGWVATVRGVQTIPGHSPYLSYEGRTLADSDGGVEQGYPGIVTRVIFRGTALALRTRTDSGELYLDVSVDGGTPRLIQAPRGDHRLSLAAGLAQGIHRVDITKRVDANVGVLDVMSASTDGTFLAPAPLPSRRLLFLGDSFVCGQSATVEDKGPIDATKALREDARLSFARILARRLDAQCHIIAYPGRGVIADWQGNRSVRCAPDYYEDTLPDDDAHRWNPAAYVPDVIGVCLGTNDFDGGIPGEVGYVKAYTEFVRVLRRDAPNAKIFLLTSPSLVDVPGRPPAKSVLRAYLEEVVRRLGDPRIRIVEIPHFTGRRGTLHPDGAAHRQVADELEPLFRRALESRPASS